MLKAKSVRGKTGASPKRGLAQYFVNNWDLYAMLLLPIVYIVIFKYVPMAGVQMAFRDYSVFKGMWDSPWVGLEHFKTFFSSSEFGKLLTNTLNAGVKKKSNKIRGTTSDRIFDVVNFIIALLALLIVLIPLLNVVASSFSSGAAVQAGKVGIIPVEPTLDAYIEVFQYGDVWIGYRNTIYYTVVGTLLNIVFTVLMAYPLARADLKGRGVIMKLLVFTMMFSGGLIPNYLLVKDLNLLNTPWALWLPGLISVYNVIVMRTFFQTTIPKELLEAAQIDGCTNRRFLWSVVLPLSKTILAVMVLLYAIGHWNSYFNAMLYISDKQKWPLQIFLREILIANQIDMTSMTGSSVQEMMRRQELQTLLKYALIVVASVPVLVVYPFVQKHLVKGVMIGSVKG